MSSYGRSTYNIENTWHGRIVDNVEVRIGNNCYLDYGSIIGAEGLGYTRDENKVLRPKAQNFGVEIQDDVFIGANTVVVRGSYRHTVIGKGTKIANRCTIGHNVIIGKNCLIGPGAILCGSCEIGDNCAIWANAVISQHVKVPEGIMINGLRLVLKGDFPVK